MRRFVWVIITLLYIPLAYANTPTIETTSQDTTIRRQLYSRLAGTLPPASSDIQGLTPLQAPEAVKRFYADREYRLAWSDPWGVSSQVDTLIAILQRAKREGLSPLDAHLRIINDYLARLSQGRTKHTKPDIALLIALDVVLSDAFFTFVDRLQPKRSYDETSENSNISTEPLELDMVQRLHQALATSDLHAAWRSLLPTHPIYNRLRHALGRYQAIVDNGGWPRMGDGPTLRLGDRGPRVVLLRHRLEITGDLQANLHATSDTFDSAMERAVRLFQQRHGISVNGVVNVDTQRALDVPASCRVQQIAINMARWRQLPKALGDRYIRVNIPDFTLTVAEGDQTIMQMRVIVGKPSWPTPTFSHTVRYLVLNPYWNVPSSIATQEILPKVQQDRSYLDTHQMEVLSGWGDDAVQVDSSRVNWQAVQPETFQYRFRQKPGPENALGQIKFMFPNKYNVYLHDTSAESLFARSSRAFSHGCIRVAQSVDLAAYLLQDQAYWTRQRILEFLSYDSEQRIPLPEPVPIYLTYESAWMDAGNTVQFRNDIYGYDQLDQCSATKSEADRLAITE